MSAQEGNIQREASLESEYTEESAIQAIGAMLFATGHPVTFDRLGAVLSISPATVRELAVKLQLRYEGSGIQLIFLEDSCQLVTKEEYADEVRSVLGVRRGGNLSRASMETLAVIAYHQPVTRSYIDEIRGVDSGYVVSALVERNLIEAVGRLEAPGRPALYGTTDTFLRLFGLQSIEELPSIDRFIKESNGGANSDEQALLKSEM